MALCTFIWAFFYAFVRYHEDFNGKYPWSMVPMYTFDKALCWAALYMMTFAMFAGNVLALRKVAYALGQPTYAGEKKVSARRVSAAVESGATSATPALRKLRLALALVVALPATVFGALLISPVLLTLLPLARW